jgi:aldehyde dehydrogenase (NAD+)
MEHPLGLYVFSQDDPSTQTIISNTISGGVTVNDVLLHAACPDAPFGGVGDSGTGSFHGKYGVLAFSHLRTVVALPTYLERFMGFRYPPYDMKNLGKAGLVSKVKFRRGEGMEDQRIKKGGGYWSWMALGLGIATVGTAIVVQSRYG